MDNEYIVIVDYKTGSFYRYGVDGKVQRSFKYEETGGEYVYISYLYVDPGYAFMDIYDSGNRNGFVMTGKEICWKKENWSILSSPSLRRSIIWFPVECPRRSINTL